MSKGRTIEPRNFGSQIAFTSNGVRISVGADDPRILGDLHGVIRAAFGDGIKLFEGKARGIPTFGVHKQNGTFKLFRDGIELTEGRSKRIFYKYLNSLLRLEVAENAVGRVFLHAGVVGWQGRAIIFPGTSFAGKSTLTAELVRAGAEYYSDEYAVIGSDGKVRPFPRYLSIRSPKSGRETSVPVSELGGAEGKREIPVGMVVFTVYEAGRTWKPVSLTAGEAIMEIVPHAFSMRRNPAFSLKVLDLVTRRAIMVKSPRGDAKKFAKLLLDFFDKNNKLAKMT